ncbi:hypothetical protein QEN19_000406 [Hanseniaspora menglaensis]
MIFSNHRSVFDYVALQSVVLKTNKNIEVKCFSWGNLIDIPNLKLIKAIFSKNENFNVDKKKINNKMNFKSTILFFPEVNVMTNKIKIVQDKFNHKNGNRVFKETLYPRYNSFLALCHIYQQFYNGFDSFLEVDKSESFKNLYFYNATITYYKPERIVVDTDLHHQLAHQKHLTDTNFSLLQSYKDLLNSKTKIETDTQENSLHLAQCKYQMLQISPSLLECFWPVNRNKKQPMIIRIHLEKVYLKSIINKSDKQLELFLENKFAAKDNIIADFENSLKLKKKKKVK